MTTSRVISLVVYLVYLSWTLIVSVVVVTVLNTIYLTIGWQWFFMIIPKEWQVSQ